jgi:hypothetical protein
MSLSQFVTNLSMRFLAILPVGLIRIRAGSQLRSHPSLSFARPKWYNNLKVIH